MLSISSAIIDFLPWWSYLFLPLLVLSTCLADGWSHFTEQFFDFRPCRKLTKFDIWHFYRSVTGIFDRTLCLRRFRSPGRPENRQQTSSEIRAVSAEITVNQRETLHSNERSTRYVAPERHRRRARKGSQWQEICPETAQVRHWRRAVRCDRQKNQRSVIYG